LPTEQLPVFPEGLSSMKLGVVYGAKRTAQSYCPSVHPFVKVTWVFRIYKPSCRKTVRSYC